MDLPTFFGRLSVNDVVEFGLLGLLRRLRLLALSLRRFNCLYLIFYIFTIFSTPNECHKLLPIA